MTTTTKTFAMIKPDAYRKQLVGDVIGIIEGNGLQIAEMKLGRLSTSAAGIFYAEHKDRFFFQDLCFFISSGPVVAMVLQLDDEDVVSVWRELMGATDSGKAAVGTIRHTWGSREVMMENIVHGSDSTESAAREIPLMFGLL